MTGVGIPPDVSGHLARFTGGLLAAIELRGLYLYGSLTTGDFSPAASDIDLLAVTARRPDGAELDRLAALHLDLARAGGAYARLNCLYAGPRHAQSAAHQGCTIPAHHGRRHQRPHIAFLRCSMILESYTRGSMHNSPGS